MSYYIIYYMYIYIYFLLSVRKLFLQSNVEGMNTQLKLIDARLLFCCSILAFYIFIFFCSRRRTSVPYFLDRRSNLVESCPNNAR